MNEIIDRIKKEIQYSDYKRIYQNPSFAPTQWSLLDLIERYSLSQFRDGDIQGGLQQVFYNISTFPVEVAAKQMDIDTKDIRIISEDENYWTAWLMEKELNQWMKESYFARELNRYVYNLPRDGHLVLKKVDNEVKIVPLRNLIFRPDNAVSSIKNIPVIEIHSYLPDEFYKEGKMRSWEQLKDVAVSSVDYQFYTGRRQDEVGKIKVYECWFPEGFLKSRDNYFLVSHDGHILASVKIDSPYKDLAWEEVEGRTLGRGQVEKIMPEQIYLNRISNYKAEGLHWTSKHLWQTRDQNINSNFLYETENGDVIRAVSEITPIAMEERNLAFYNQEEQRWEQNAFKKTFTTEPLTGSRAPAGTPLGSTILQAKMAGGFYDQKKENLASFIKEVLWDWVIPEFKKAKKGKHEIFMKNLMSSDEDSEKFFKLQLSEKMRKLMVSSKYLTSEQWKIRRGIQAEILRDQKVEIPRSVYEDLKYKLEITIEGEEMDLAGKSQVLQTVLQLLSTNPAILQDKRTRKVFYKMLDIAGFNPREIDLEEPEMGMEEQVQQVANQRGGSTARPQPNSFSQLPQTIMA